MVCMHASSSVLLSPLGSRRGGRVSSRSSCANQIEAGHYENNRTPLPLAFVSFLALCMMLKGGKTYMNHSLQFKVNASTANASRSACRDTILLQDAKPIFHLVV